MKSIVPNEPAREVRGIMTSEVVTVEPETTVDEIAALMGRHELSGLPVVDYARRVLGIVTELDIVVRYTRFKPPPSVTVLEATIYLESPRHVRERMQHMMGITAREIMTTPPATIGPGASLTELAELIVEQRANPVAVVEDGRLVGIVSAADIVKLLARTAES